MKENKPRKNGGGDEGSRAESLRKELKDLQLRTFDALKRAKPPMTPAHVAVHDVLWTFANTDFLNAGAVANVYPDASAVMNRAAIRDPRTLAKVLDWLVAHDVVWRVLPPTEGERAGQHVLHDPRIPSGERILSHGVAVYGIHFKATEWMRASWVHGWAARGCTVQGGRRLTRAQELTGQVAVIRSEVSVRAERIGALAREAFASGETMEAVEANTRAAFAAASREEEKAGRPFHAEALRRYLVEPLLNDAAQRAGIVAAARKIRDGLKAQRAMAKAGGASPGDGGEFGDIAARFASDLVRKAEGTPARSDTGTEGAPR